MIKGVRNPKKGFTLLEVLVTMVIAGVLLSTVLFSFISARQITIRNRNRVIALSHCVSTLEFLRNYVTVNTTNTIYYEPWAPSAMVYALNGSASGVTHSPIPFTFDSQNSALNLLPVPWVRQYIVTDVPCSDTVLVPATTAVLKRVSITVRPGP